VAVYTHVSAEALAAFLERYDVGELVSAKGIAEGVENTNYLVDTTRGRFFLTLYEKRVRADDLPFFLALLDHLAMHGCPVPTTIKDRQGIALQQLEGRTACLIQFLPGVSPSHPTPAQAGAVGQALAKMHRASADFQGARPNSMGLDSWQPLFDRCGASLNEIAPSLYDDLGQAIGKLQRDWPAGATASGGVHNVIHADLFPDNVLMRGAQVTGLIDFYFACSDSRRYDLAITHSAWSFDTTGSNFDPEIGNALIDGYEIHFASDPIERAEFNTLASGACVRFTLSRAWDWLNTPADALVTRKDPVAYWRRYKHYDPDMAATMKSLA